MTAKIRKTKIPLNRLYEMFPYLTKPTDKWGLSIPGALECLAKQPKPSSDTPGESSSDLESRIGIVLIKNQSSDFPDPVEFDNWISYEDSVRDYHGYRVTEVCLVSTAGKPLRLLSKKRLQSFNHQQPSEISRGDNTDHVLCRNSNVGYVVVTSCRSDNDSACNELSVEVYQIKRNQPSKDSKP